MNSTFAGRSTTALIGPDDPRYSQLQLRGFNKRFASSPDHFRLVSSTDDIIEALEYAVSHGLRVVVRSGGHCLEGFVDDPAVRVIIDMSVMTGVSYDSAMFAFAIEAGTTLGEVHRKLFMGWGVVLPAGQSPDIGIGGHVLGGGFGFLHRAYGLACDHLYAVEVVTVDSAGNASSVIATREEDDPYRELWWAHTGCGGGNFGIVTRYWFRSPDSDGRSPTEALPTAPASVATLKAEWNWQDIDERTFTQLIANFGDWSERNAQADSPNATMFAVLLADYHYPGAKIVLRAMSIAGTSAEEQLQNYLREVTNDITPQPIVSTSNSTWLKFALDPFPDLFATNPGGTNSSLVKMKAKDALLRKRHNDRQIAAMYRHLTRPDLAIGGAIGFATYGGRINSAQPDATASVHRSSIMDTSYGVGWMDAEAEARSLAWVRELYQDVFAETGGVPAPNASNEGAMINHPDADLADPSINTSDVPWHRIYYGDNYSRLQRVKAEWDPNNVFHHALSIRLPDNS
jgi:FAD/FMN-containing dehydrogenase